MPAGRRKRPRRTGCRGRAGGRRQRRSPRLPFSRAPQKVSPKPASGAACGSTGVPSGQRVRSLHDHELSPPGRPPSKLDDLAIPDSPSFTGARAWPCLPARSRLQGPPCRRRRPRGGTSSVPRCTSTITRAWATEFAFRIPDELGTRMAHQRPRRWRDRPREPRPAPFRRTSGPERHRPPLSPADPDAGAWRRGEADGAPAARARRLSATSTTGLRGVQPARPGQAETFAHHAPSKGGAQTSLRAKLVPWPWTAPPAWCGPRRAPIRAAAWRRRLSCPAATPAVNACLARSYLVLRIRFLRFGLTELGLGPARLRLEGGLDRARASTCPARTCSPSAARICEKPPPATTGRQLHIQSGQGPPACPRPPPCSGNVPACDGLHAQRAPDGLRPRSRHSDGRPPPMRRKQQRDSRDPHRRPPRDRRALFASSNSASMARLLAAPRFRLGLEHRDQRGAPDAIILSLAISSTPRLPRGMNSPR